MRNSEPPTISRRTWLAASTAALYTACGGSRSESDAPTSSQPPTPAQPPPPAPASSVPAWASGLADFEVRNLTGATFGPTNGYETMSSRQPVAWRLTGQPHGADNVFGAWGGGKGDADGRRLFVHGGGHGDSSNNGLHYYDFNGATKPTGWVIAPNSQTATPPAITPNEPTGGVYADGKPVAIHAYDQQWFCPTAQRWYRFSGAAFSQSGNASGYAWYYDMGASAWTRWGPALSAGEPHGSGILIASPDGSKFLSVGGNSNARFITAAGVRTSAGNPLWTWDDGANHTAAYDSLNDRWLTVGYQAGLGGQACWTFQVDWATNAITNVTRRTIAFPVPIEGASIAYDAAMACFWVFGGMIQPSTMTKIYKVDANTFAVTTYTLTGDSIAVASGGGNGAFNRHVWFPQWRVIGTVHSHAAPMSVIKLPTPVV